MAAGVSKTLWSIEDIVGLLDQFKAIIVAPRKSNLGKPMKLLDNVRTAWGFTGLIPRSIVDANAFGNLLVEDIDDRIWRICPEELSCKPVASSARDLRGLRESPDFRKDWEMERLVMLATSVLGTPTEGRCFCLKIPAVLGGSYERDNLATITLSELIAVSGNIASQIRDLPDGANITLKVIE